MIHNEMFFENDYFNFFTLLLEDAHKDNRKIDAVNKTLKNIIKFVESQLTPQEKKEIKTNLYNRDWDGSTSIQNLKNIQRTSVGYEFSIFQSINDKNIKLEIVLCNKNIYPKDHACYEYESDVLILPFMYNNKNILDLYTIRNFYLFKGIIIHELIHWIDDIEWDIGQIKSKDYYNKPDEFNSYSLQMIDYIKDQMLSNKNLKSSIKDIIKDGGFEKFWKNTTDNGFIFSSYPIQNFEAAILNNFYNSLTDKNKKRLISRVSNYFKDILSKKESTNLDLIDLLLE